MQCQSHGHSCSHCLSPPAVDWKNAQRVLEHFGAQILFDPQVDRTSEPCGFCLRSTFPSSTCVFYLTKSSNQVDSERSHGCPNLPTRFSYKTAAESTERSPCTNRPICCELCGPGSPSIWMYNMEVHLRCVHPSIPLDAYRSTWEILPGELEKMKSKWATRHLIVRRRTEKRGRALEISDAHTSNLALRYVLFCNTSTGAYFSDVRSKLSRTTHLLPSNVDEGASVPQLPTPSSSKRPRVD